MTRVQTGIPQLDEMLRGGFLEKDAVMVAGSPGTGKTTLALQYVANGITKYGENGIFVTFEQLPDQLYRDALSLGIDLRKMEQEDKLRVVCTSPDLLLETSGAEHLLDPFIAEVRARRIAIDSLSHLRMYVPEDELRKETYRLIMYLKAKELTPLVTWESAQMMGALASITDVGISFLVDEIILLRQVEIESAIRKALVILKMRGSDHDKQLREYAITSAGVVVHEPFKDYEGVLTGSPRSLPRVSEQAVSAWAAAFERRRKNH